MKQGKVRTMSICLSDIPKDKILKHENGKMYLNLRTWDNDEPDQYDNDFSVSVPLSKEELKRKKEGEDIKTVYLGNGRIWEQQSSMQPAKPEEIENDLPF